MEEDWTSWAVRQRVVSQFDELIRQTPEGSKRSAQDLENSLFQQATKREDYQKFVTKILNYLKDQAAQVQNQNNNSSNLPNMLQGSNVSAPQMNQGISTTPQLQQAGVSSGNQMISTNTNQAQMVNSQHLSHGNTSGGQMTHAANRGTIGSMGPGVMMAGPPGLQQQNPAAMPQPGMVGGMTTPSDMVSWQNQQKNQRATEMIMNMNQKRGGMNPVSVMNPQQKMGNIAMSISGPSDHMGPMTVTGHIRPSMQTRVPSPGFPGGQHPRQNMVPTNVGGLPTQPQVQHSSIAFMSPSPNAASSPVGGRAINQLGTPSPGGMINTPGQPISQMPSPAAGATVEERAYTEKVKQMKFKYLDTLMDAIQTLGNSDPEKTRKLKNLLGVLENPQKRGTTLENLKQCEALLERLIQHREAKGELLKQPMRENPVSTFFDAINLAMKSPHGTHTIHRTLAPAMRTLLGPDLEPPLPKNCKLDISMSQASDSHVISDLIQGEVARLPPRFKVNLDTHQAPESDDLVLVCQLDDENLPCVPPITLILPPSYPDMPPSCKLSHVDYDATEFLKKVRQIMSNWQLHLPEVCTLTMVLDAWEMSVRQACSDKLYIPDTVNPLLNLHSLWQ